MVKMNVLNPSCFVSSLIPTSVRLQVTKRSVHAYALSFDRQYACLFVHNPYDKCFPEEGPLLLPLDGPL